MTLRLAYSADDDAIPSHVQLSADIAAAIARVGAITDGLEAGRIAATPAVVHALEDATAELEALVARLP